MYSRMRVLHSRTTRAALALALVAVFVAIFYVEPVRLLNEKKILALFPSAARAYAYGERHFNAKAPRSYNIEAAEYFLLRTLLLDSEHPYVMHELARIAFLKSNFPEALRLISTQIEKQGDAVPSSYYVKGLVEGYMGRYDDAAKDYEIFLKYQPTNWAALNDYAWVLLKAGRFAEAHEIALRGLTHSPDNAWLLNSDAVALSEMGDFVAALAQARKALAAFENVTKKDWLVAYPGNDPKVASQGLSSFKNAILENIHMLETKLSSTTVQ